MNNPKPMKIDPEFRKWLEGRRDNIQKMLVVEKLTMMDTQRIIARTSGVDITREILRRFRKK